MDILDAGINWQRTSVSSVCRHTSPYLDQDYNLRLAECLQHSDRLTTLDILHEGIYQIPVQDIIFFSSVLMILKSSLISSLNM